MFRPCPPLMWLLLIVGYAVSGQPVLEAQDWQPLGSFTVGAFEGAVVLGGRDTDLLVDVIVWIPNPVKAVPAETIRVWVLLEDGKAAVFRTRDPLVGRAPVETCTGGCQAHITFTFDKPIKPVGVVVAFDGHFELFPVAEKGQLK